MADIAFQKQFRQEMIAAYEVGETLLRDTVTTEIVSKGNQAEFLVGGSGGASAVTRGVDGLIPADVDDVAQTTVTLVEWHRLVRRTRFNIFASQGNVRALMQRTVVAALNRRIDSDIVTELATASVNTGAAATASLNLAIHAMTILQNSDVPWDGNVTALITPAFHGYLSQVAEYASADYVNGRPNVSADMAWADRRKMKQWMGVNWIVHPSLPGATTNAEKCFMYHKDAIGHAMDMDGLNTAVGYDDEQDYSYARASAFMGTQILQNSGIVVMNHDGSGFAAS